MTKIFEYSSGLVPQNYKCQNCGKSNCKLWRKSAHFNIKLFCVDCGISYANGLINRHYPNSKKINPLNVKENGMHNDGYMESDQFYGLCPAVPAEDGGYWGYVSVPEDGCVWWRNLPLRSSE